MPRTRRPTIGRSRVLAATVLISVIVAVLLGGQLLTRGAASTTAVGLNPDRWPALAIGARPVSAGSSAARTELIRRANAMDDRPDLTGRVAAPPERLTGYRWPLQHARITQAFGRSRIGLFIVDGQGFHDGIDVASFCGDHVVAAHDGVVIAAGRRTDGQMGWIGDLAAYHARLDAKNLWGSLAIAVITDDGNGYRSVYIHFRRIVVKAGQPVHAGELLGLEGSTGHSTGCHLHYSLFSPDAAGRFTTDPKRVRETSLPAAETARVDPLIVLPPLPTAGITWGWGAQDPP